MRCKSCGTIMIANKSIVYTSDPPQYMYECPICHNRQFGLTSQCNEVEDKSSAIRITQREIDTFRNNQRERLMALSKQELVDIIMGTYNNYSNTEGEK